MSLHSIHFNFLLIKKYASLGVFVGALAGLSARKLQITKKKCKKQEERERERQNTEKEKTKIKLIDFHLVGPIGYAHFQFGFAISTHCKFNWWAPNAIAKTAAKFQLNDFCCGKRTAVAHAKNRLLSCDIMMTTTATWNGRAAIVYDRCWIFFCISILQSESIELRDSRNALACPWTSIELMFPLQTRKRIKTMWRRRQQRWWCRCRCQWWWRFHLILLPRVCVWRCAYIAERQ